MLALDIQQDSLARRPSLCLSVHNSHCLSLSLHQLFYGRGLAGQVFFIFVLVFLSLFFCPLYHIPFSVPHWDLGQVPLQNLYAKSQCSERKERVTTQGRQGDQPLVQGGRWLKSILVSGRLTSGGVPILLWVHRTKLPGQRVRHQSTSTLGFKMKCFAFYGKDNFITSLDNISWLNTLCMFILTDLINTSVMSIVCQALF